MVDRRYVTKGTKTEGCRWCCQRSILSFHFVQPFSLKTPPRFIFDLNKSLNLVTVLMAQENAWMIFSNVFSVEWWMKGLCFELWEKKIEFNWKSYYWNRHRPDSVSNGRDVLQQNNRFICSLLLTFPDSRLNPLKKTNK